MIQYKELTDGELCRELFLDFIRHQVVTKPPVRIVFRRQDTRTS